MDALRAQLLVPRLDVVDEEADVVRPQRVLRHRRVYGRGRGGVLEQLENVSADGERRHSQGRTGHAEALAQLGVVCRRAWLGEKLQPEDLAVPVDRPLQVRHDDSRVMHAPHPRYLSAAASRRSR